MSASSLYKDYGETNFITGLRAVAALMVVLIHSGGAGLRELGPIGNNLADLGRTGVYVFFVISGFSIAVSYAQSAGYIDYLNRRLWRIVPLYYFWLAVAVLFGLTSTSWLDNFGMKVDVYNLAMHISFLSFLDYRISNTLLGVEWSIPIEVFWYFLLPVLLVPARSWLGLIGLVSGALLLYLLVSAYPAFLPVPTDQATLALHWSPIPYILSYAVGIAVYRLRERWTPNGKAADAVLGLSLLLLAVFSIQPRTVLMLFGDEFIFITFITALIISFGTSHSRLYQYLLSGRTICFLGSISYGIYLAHMPIISLLGSLALIPDEATPTRFAIVAVCAILISYATHRLFEVRLQKFGRQLGKKLFAR